MYGRRTTSGRDDHKAKLTAMRSDAAMGLLAENCGG